MAVTNSFPAFHTTGPVINYIRVGAYASVGVARGSIAPAIPTSGTIYYLGTCEKQPVLRINRMYSPIFNDIGGSAVPVQEVMIGQDADIGLLLTRFSQAAIAALSIAGPEANGIESRLSRGGLVNGPRTFELWQYFSFYGTDQATDGLPIGYYWPQVKLISHQPDRMGTDGKAYNFVAKATPRWFAPVSGSAPTTTFSLYSQNAADFAQILNGGVHQ